MAFQSPDNGQGSGKKNKTWKDKADVCTVNILKTVVLRRTDKKVHSGLLVLTVAVTMFRFITGIFCVTSDCSIQYTAGVYFLARSVESILFWTINMILSRKYPDGDEPLHEFPFQLYVCISVLANLVVFVVCAKLVFENFNEISSICPSTRGRGTAATIVVISDCVYIAVFIFTITVLAARELS